MKPCTSSIKATKHEHLINLHVCFMGHFGRKDRMPNPFTKSRPSSPDRSLHILSFVVCVMSVRCLRLGTRHVDKQTDQHVVLQLLAKPFSFKIRSSMAVPGGVRSALKLGHANVRRGDWGKEGDPRLSKTHRISSLGKPRSSVLDCARNYWSRSWWREAPRGNHQSLNFYHVSDLSGAAPLIVQPVLLRNGSLFCGG
jgi:hypothetical protein